jgi:hypothetical protein
LKDFSFGDARLEIEVEKLRSSTLQLNTHERKGGKNRSRKHLSYQEKIATLNFKADISSEWSTES